MYRLILWLSLFCAQNVFSVREVCVFFEDDGKTHHQTFSFNSDNEAEGFKLFYSSFLQTSGKNLTKSPKGFHDAQRYFREHLVSDCICEDKEGFEEVWPLEGQHFDLTSPTLSINDAQKLVRLDCSHTTFPDFRIADKIVAVLSSDVLKKETRYRGLPFFKKFEGTLDDYSRAILTEILCSEKSVPEKIGRLRQDKIFSEHFLTENRDKALTWLLSDKRAHPQTPMYQGYVFRGFQPFAGDDSLVFQKAGVWQVGETLSGFFENGLPSLYGRFEDGFNEDMEQDRFQLKGPMSMRMNGTEDAGVTSAYGSSCTIDHTIAVSYAKSRGSVVFFLDVRAMDSAHAVFKIFPTNPLRQVNVEDTIKGSQIVGVWPVADTSTFIPNPHYQGLGSIVCQVSLPKGAFEIEG